jgi:hypothetical protein
MKWLFALFAAAVLLVPVANTYGQQSPPPAPPAPTAPQPPTRIEARSDVVVNWSLGDQVWLFNEVLTAYQPVKGYLEPRPNEGNLAVWRLKLAKEFEEGVVKLHEQMRGSPFKIVLLDAERTVVTGGGDVPAQITTVSGKMGDTIELLVGLPDAAVLKEVKIIRVQRRTEVGF